MTDIEHLLGGLLTEVERRGFRLYLTIDPRRDGFGAEIDPADVGMLKLTITGWSSALLGLLVARGIHDLRWLETLTGADAACTVAKTKGEPSPPIYENPSGERS